LRERLGGEQVSLWEIGRCLAADRGGVFNPQRPVTVGPTPSETIAILPKQIPPMTSQPRAARLLAVLLALSPLAAHSQATSRDASKAAPAAASPTPAKTAPPVARVVPPRLPGKVMSGAPVKVTEVEGITDTASPTASRSCCSRTSPSPPSRST